MYMVIYMYIILLVEQVYWYISQVSGERLQDHNGPLVILKEDLDTKSNSKMVTVWHSRHVLVSLNRSTSNCVET